MRELFSARRVGGLVASVSGRMPSYSEDQTACSIGVCKVGETSALLITIPVRHATPACLACSTANVALTAARGPPREYANPSYPRASMAPRDDDALPFIALSQKSRSHHHVNGASPPTPRQSRLRHDRTRASSRQMFALRSCNEHIGLGVVGAWVACAGRALPGAHWWPCCRSAASTIRVRRALAASAARSNSTPRWQVRSVPAGRQPRWSSAVRCCDVRVLRLVPVDES